MANTKTANAALAGLPQQTRLATTRPIVSSPVLWLHGREGAWDRDESVLRFWVSRGFASR